MAFREADLTALLDTVPDPLTGRGLVQSGRISGMVIKGAQVSFALTVPPHERSTYQKLSEDLEKTISAQSGVQACHIILTQEKPSPQKLPKLDTIKQIIAVGSGKGGVGKSTVSLNLALGWAKKGLKVGLLDADIYGPSLPTMLGVTDLPTSQEKMIQPVTIRGLQFMSIGLLVPDHASLVWRGPLLQKALIQMLWGVDWGELDVLVIDLPPGTGDIQITLCQKGALTGAIVVSTPQDLSLIDAQKAVDMFQKVQVPVLGLIENMSSFHCAYCGEAAPIFDQGTVKDIATKWDVPFLGSVPLKPQIREDKVALDDFSGVLEALPTPLPQ